MKKLLIISYDFPPAIAGVRRILKWIKYLPEFGWQCSVLTVKEFKGEPRDAAPLTWLKNKGVPVFRSFSLDPYFLLNRFVKRKKSANRVKNQASPEAKSVMNILRRWIFIPDDRCGWIPFATIKGFFLIKKIKPDIILTTSYPHTAHIVGLKLKILTKIPWVADFRDAWTTNPVLFKPATPLHRMAQSGLEKWVAKRCDFLLSVSDPITNHFKNLDLPRKDKIVTLTNGYDEDDFQGLTPKKPEKFRIVYTGTIFGKRSALSFFRAILKVVQKHPEWKDDMEALFYCALPENIQKFIQENRLDSVIRIMGLCSYKQSLQNQMNATVLALFIGLGPNSEVMMTQKVFEYLRTARPILAMIPKGACRTLLTKFGDEYIADPEDEGKIAHFLEELYEKWKTGRMSAPNRNGIEKFERRNLTQRLAGYLDQL